MHTRKWTPKLKQQTKKEPAKIGWQIMLRKKLCEVKKRKQGRRGGSRTAATSKMELFVIIVNASVSIQRSF